MRTFALLACSYVAIALAACGSHGGVVPSRPACGGATGTPCGTFTTYPVPFASPDGIVYDDAGTLRGIWFTNSTLDATVRSRLPEALRIPA